MKIKVVTFALAVAGIGSVLASSLTAAPDANPEDFWKSAELFKTPRYRQCPWPESDYQGLQALMVEGRGPGGTNAEFFAYFAKPEGPAPKGGFPGLLLVHGGGGTAFPNYVQEFVKDGFAVLALDWYNQRPAPALTNVPPTEVSLPRVPLAGGKRQDHVANVANMVLAHSLLRSFPEVDASRTVYVGLSWGSWYGSCVTAVDNRFKGACMIYLCDRHPDATANPKTGKFVRGPFHRSMKVPCWWIVWPKDSNGLPSTFQAGWEACPCEAGRTVVHNLGHSHEGFSVAAVHRMARYFAGEDVRVPRLSLGRRAGRTVSAEIVDAGKGVAEAQLWYTDRPPLDISELTKNAKTEWRSAPAKIEGTTVSATLPEGARIAYLSVYEAKQSDSRRRVFSGSSGFFHVESAAAADEGYRLYNVVPMYLGHEAEQAAKSVEMYERTGEDLALYSLTLHPEGRPATEKVDRYVASYRAFAQALKGTKVRPAVLVQSILGHWPRTDKDIEPWERTIDQDGKVVRFCPLDPGFGAYIEYVFRALAAEHPAFILTDDDVRAFSHGAECFCKTHVKTFNERHGTSYDSDGLRAAVAASKPGEKIYDGFFALQREMMHEAVVGRIRTAIDSVDPAIEAGFCIAGEETYLAAPMARRIAAKGQTPVMRCATGCYGERLSAERFPFAFLRQMSFCELYRGSGIELLDEADTCPQNLWSKTARSFLTHMVTSCFAGMQGAKTWHVNSIRSTGIPVTTAYTDVLAENRGFLDALGKAVRGTSQVGVAIPCFTNRPAWHLVHNHNQFMTEPGGIFEIHLAAYGIPGYACRELGDKDRVFALTSEEEVERMTDAELAQLFSGRVLVLRDAAVALTKRGLSWMTGVTAEMKPLMFNGEHDLTTGTWLGYSPALSGSVEFRLADGAECLGNLTFRPYAGAPNPEVVAPATAFYRNRLGGETITMAYHHRMYGLQKFGEGRKRQLIALIDRLAGGTVFTVCGNDQDVMVAERAVADGSRLVMAVNLSSDPIRALKLRRPDGTRLERLMPDGTWRAPEGDIRVEFYETAVVRIVR